MRARRLTVILGVALAGMLAVVAPASAATPGSAQLNVTPGLLGFDSLNVETPAQIACLSAAGYSFDLVNTNGTNWADEYNATAAAGMDVVLFQGYDPTTWPTVSQGTVRGQAAGSKAASVGYPTGSQIFLNLENNTNADAATAIQWVTNWASAIRAAGYTPGVYVGVPQVLSQAQVNALPVSVFWRSASSSAPQASAGFVVRQTAVSQSACGIPNGIDTDVAGQDLRGAQAQGAGFPATPTMPTVPGAFVPVGPTRILDTRPGTVAPNGTLVLTVGGRAGVPTSASAVVLNITVTRPTAPGYITAYKAGTPRPKASTLDFATGQTVANLVIAPISSDGKVALTSMSGGTVQLIADVQGYYLGGTPTANGAYVPLTPTRLLDTRPGSVAGGADVTVQITNRAAQPTNIPAGVAAVVLNVAVVNPTAPGYITAYPDGSALPRSSNLDYAPGQTVANLVTVKVGSDGRIALHVGSGRAAQLIADVQGYYLPGDGTSPGTFVAINPYRALDTRPTAVAPSAAQAVRVAGSGPIAAGAASAVVANLAVTAPTGGGYLTAFPSGITRPVVSNLDFPAAQTVANLGLVPVGRDDKIVLYNGAGGSSQFLVDLFGYFRS